MKLYPEENLPDELTKVCSAPAEDLQFSLSSYPGRWRQESMDQKISLAYWTADSL